MSLGWSILHQNENNWITVIFNNLCRIKVLANINLFVTEKILFEHSGDIHVLVSVTYLLCT